MGSDLHSSVFEDDFCHVRNFTDPEILRTNRVGYLQMTARVSDIAAFLCLSKRRISAIFDGVRLLKSWGRLPPTRTANGI